MFQGKFSVSRNIVIIYIYKYLIHSYSPRISFEEYISGQNDPFKDVQSLYCQIILFFVGYDGVFSQTMEDRCFFSQVIQPVDVLHSWKAALNGQGLVPRTLATVILGSGRIPCLPHFVPWQFVHHVVLWNFRVTSYITLRSSHCSTNLQNISRNLPIQIDTTSYRTEKKT